MESKHTKGEWIISYNYYGFATSIRSNHHICVMRTNNQEECNANAKLIAAAPELLSALKEAYRMLPYGNEALGIMIKNIIDKATK